MAEDDDIERLLDEAGQREREEPLVVPAFVPTGQASLLDIEGMVDDLGEGFDDPTLLSGPSAIASLGMRARAVAYTRPLHDLEANKGRLGGEAWARLNLVELGFHAVDVVALRMDFDSGARHDDVISAIAGLAQQQDPQIDDPWRVGEKVLEGLITGRGGGDAEAHRVTYGSWGTDGYVAKRFDYALLTEHIDEDGAFYLRVTDPAISVLMGALDIDVESAQIASELRLNELVKRGLLTAAIQEAQRAKYRTIQYTNQLQGQIAHAQMNTTEAGAIQAVDELVDHSLTHVIDRYRAERAIIANVAGARDEAEDPRVRRRANQLITELEQCELRHQHLQKRLIRARSEFREAHAEQLATAPAPPSRVDLERQLLRPILRMPLDRADRFSTLLFALSVSPEPPSLVDPEQLVGALCALPPAADNLGESVDGDDDLVDVPDRRRFDDLAWDEVDALLDAIEAPTRLSELVGQLDQPETAHLLVLQAMHGFDPGLAEHVRTIEQPGNDPEVRILWWRPDGSFETDNVTGDDLAVFPAWVVGDPDALPPDPFGTSDAPDEVHHER
jgi:hypothetical protein